MTITNLDAFVYLAIDNLMMHRGLQGKEDYT